MSSGNPWEPPDTGAGQDAEPHAYAAYPPPPAGYAQPGYSQQPPYPPYPQYGPGQPYPAPVPLPRPPMPRPVHTAVTLMWLSAILTSIQTIVECAAASQNQGFGPSAYYISGGFTARAAGGMIPSSVIGVMLFGGIFFCGLWVWMLAICRRGRNWGRVLSSVFYGLSVLGLLNLLRTGISGFDVALSLVITVMATVALVALWSAQSGPYFREPLPAMPMMPPYYGAGGR